jgi:hypothetical protein
MLASHPDSILNQIPDKLGIPKIQKMRILL